MQTSQDRVCIIWRKASNGLSIPIDGINLFECFTRNPFHIDPDYEFQQERDYLHDSRLMRHHLKCHRRTIKDLDRYS